MDQATVTSITSAVDFTTIIAGIGAVGAAVVVILVAFRGMKMLLGAVRSA